MSENAQQSTLGIGPRILEEESMADVEEIAAYDRIAQAFLDILHRGFVETVLNHCPKGGRVLEVGTGTGWISIGLAKADPSLRIVASDISAPMLEVAQRNAAREGVAGRIDFRLSDGKGLAFDDDSFDGVYCHNMLHHVEHPARVLKEMQRVVRDDGALLARDLVRLPNFWIPFHVHGFGLRYSKLMKREYRDSICAALSRCEWRELAAELGFGPEAVSRQFVTHQTMARPARDRRAVYEKLPGPLFARLYATRPPPQERERVVLPALPARLRLQPGKESFKAPG